MSAIGNLVVTLEANMAQYATDMGRAAAIAEQRSKEISKAIGSVKGALGAIGIGVSVGAVFETLKTNLEGVISAGAGLQQFAERSGVAASSLNGLITVAKLSGTGAEEVVVGIQKLSKSMNEAANGAPAAAEAFHAIGISTDEFKNKKPDEMFLLVSKRLEEFADGAGKTALAQQLLGKSGANLLPAMKDLADVGEVQIKITDEQIAQLDAYDKNTERVKLATTALYQTVGFQMVPAMDAFEKALLEAMTSSDGLKGTLDGLSQDGSIQAWAIKGAEAVAFVIDAFDGVARVVEVAGLALGAGAAKANFILHGQLTEAKAVDAAFGKESQAILARTGMQTRLQKQIDSLNWDNPEPTAKAKPRPQVKFNPRAGTVPLDDPTNTILQDNLKQQENTIKDMDRVLADHLKTVQWLNQNELLNVRQTETIKQNLIEKELAGKEVIWAAERALIEASISSSKSDVNRAKGHEALTVLAGKESQARITAADAIKDSQFNLIAVQLQLNNTTEEFTRLQKLANDQAAFDIDVMGMGTLEIQKRTAARKIQLDTDEKIRQARHKDPEVDVTNLVAAGAQAQLKAVELVTASFERQQSAVMGVSEAFRKYSEDANNVGAQLENVMTKAFSGMEDALVTFVTTGKLSFQGLADSIVADITRIIIKQQISNAMGLGGAGGSGGSGVLGLLGMAVDAMSGTSGVASVASSMGGDSLDNMLKLTNNFAGKASGGAVAASSMYRVNEEGPELLETGGQQYLLMGNRGGNITPNKDAVGAAGKSIVVQNTFHVGANTDLRTQQQIAAMAGQSIQRALARSA